MNQGNMESKNDRLDPKVLTIALIVGIIEFEVFTFAKGVIAIAKQDAWISILLGGAITFLTAYLMVKLSTRFPKENFIQYSKKVWGKPVAVVMVILLLIYWFIYLVLLYKDSSMATEFYYLKRTPPLIPIAFVAGVAGWLALYGLTVIIRFFQITAAFLVLPLILIMVLVMPQIDLSNFFPILSEGFLPVLKGAVFIAGAFQGLELILFTAPFLNDPQKAIKPVFYGIGFIVGIAFFMVVATIGSLGVVQAEEAVYPGVEVIRLIEVPGLFAERFEFFLTLPWIVGVFTTICLFTYLLSYGFCQIIKIQNRKAVVFIISALVVAGTAFFPNFAWELKVRNNINYATFFFVLLLPVLTLLLAALRKKRGSNE